MDRFFLLNLPGWPLQGYSMVLGFQPRKMIAFHLEVCLGVAVIDVMHRHQMQKFQQSMQQRLLPLRHVGHALKILHHHRPIRTVHVHVGDPVRLDDNGGKFQLEGWRGLKHPGGIVHDPVYAITAGNVLDQGFGVMLHPPELVERFAQMLRVVHRGDEVREDLPCLRGLEPEDQVEHLAPMGLTPEDTLRDAIARIVVPTQGRSIDGR
mmetsp:Transcript_27729/g.60405  ORF Transcript_27729/g.60405 Transcript_27729/m.60405 type:complete len:208 (+) Transcript_27729:2-625(+)